LQTDVSATIVAATLVTPKRTGLLTTFAARSDYRGVRHVKARDEFGARPARIVDAEDREMAPDYRAWIDAELEKHGGSARAVWATHKDAGYRLTEIQPVLHYFLHDRGGAQENFVQIEVWEEQEFVERELFPRGALGPVERRRAAPRRTRDAGRAHRTAYRGRAEVPPRASDRHAAVHRDRRGHI
jgi:hypothetical protein